MRFLLAFVRFFSILLIMLAGYFAPDRSTAAYWVGIAVYVEVVAISMRDS